MTLHIFGMHLTHSGTFANNRGETEGATNTLQKVIRNGEQYTVISADAIRYALRDGWQQNSSIPEDQLNRYAPDHRHVDFNDREFNNWQQRIDDDLLGFMHAKKETVSRRGVLEITRAISTTPWEGLVHYHFASPGSNPGVSSDNPIPYSIEVHDTRYQFGFALTPEAIGREGNNGNGHDIKEQIRRVNLVLQGLLNLRRVGGNHARYFADYSPEVLVLRITDDPAPRFLYCFCQDEIGRIHLDSLLRLINGGDVQANEFIIGAACDIENRQKLKDLGVTLLDGVKSAMDSAMEEIKKKLNGSE